MFIHIFIYRLKCLLRDKETVFWTLFFPLILATLFNLAFSNLDANEKFDAINIAVVNNTSYNENTDFKQTLHKVSSGDERIFILNETTQEDAEELLENGSIDVIIILEPEIHLIVKDTGSNENIVKIFLEEYIQTSDATINILTSNQQSSEKVIESISNRLEYTKYVSMSGSEPNVILNYFYSLIAMACFYGAFWGSREIVDIQANISPLAARINMSPVHKLKTFLFSISSSLLILYTELLVLISYLYFVLGINFGAKLGYVLLTTLVGSICGLTFGAFISAMVKKNETIKTAIIIGTTMLGSFLSGMMYAQIKFIIAQKIPILSYINPVNLLTDAYYSLYYYDTFERYWINMGILGVFILLFSFETYMILRRQKYASL